MAWNDVFRALTGNTYDELVKSGRANYPDLPKGSAHHAQGMEQLAAKLKPYIGAIPALGASQIAGGGMEVLEYLRGDPQAGFTKDTKQDLAANLLGAAKGTGLDEVIAGLMAGR